MMTLQEYIKEYSEIAQRGSERCENMIIDFDVWVTIRWLDEINAEPWESDKIMSAICELVDSEEFQLIDTVGRGMSKFFQLERKMWEHIDGVESERGNNGDDGHN